MKSYFEISRNFGVSVDGKKWKEKSVWKAGFSVYKISYRRRRMVDTYSLINHFFFLKLVQICQVEV